MYGRPNRSADGGLRGIIYSVECEFFVDICLCYHNSNDTYYVRIKLMEFVPYVPMLPSWIIILLVRFTWCLSVRRGRGRFLGDIQRREFT